MSISFAFFAPIRAAVTDLTLGLGTVASAKTAHYSVLLRKKSVTALPFGPFVINRSPSSTISFLKKLFPMKQIFAIAIAISLFGFLSAAQAQEPEKLPEANLPNQDQVELPESEAAVFKMEFSRKRRLHKLPGAVRHPYLQVFADGRVVSSTFLNEVNEIRLTPEQLQVFLNQVVNENHFYELDIAPPPATPSDAGTLKISIELARGTRAIVVDAAKSTDKQPLKTDSLKQIAKIEDLGRKLALTADAGGFENIERALSKVNEQLKAKKLGQMSVNEIYRANQKNDTVTIFFNRKITDENGSLLNWVNARYTDTGDEEAVKISTKKDNNGKKLKPIRRPNSKGRGAPRIRAKNSAT